MSQYHLKRLPAPETWGLKKKAEKYVTRPNPGAHNYKLGTSLNTVMTKVGLANTKKEVKYLLQNREVLVDGKQRHDENLPVGLMDVISLPETDQNYRIIIAKEGLIAYEISDDEAGLKPVKITGKSQIKGGKTQIHTLDGRNIVVDEDEYNVDDTLLIEIPSQEIQDHIELEKGNKILLYQGTHAGEVGTVEDIEGNRILFSTEDEEFETKADFAFVIGEEEPVIKIQNG